MAPENILKLMKGATAQSPMALTNIAKKADMPKDACKAVLDDLYHMLPSRVNRAHIMRKNVWEYFYWPTCVIKKFTREDRSIAMRKGFSPNNILPSECTSTQNKPIKELELEMSNGKFSNVDIVKLVLANPGITALEIKDKLSQDNVVRNRINSQITQCLGNGYLAKDDAGHLLLGDNEIWLAQHGIAIDKVSIPAGLATSSIEASEKPSEQQRSPEAQADNISLDSGEASHGEGTPIGESSTVEPLQQAAADLGMPNINSFSEAELEIIKSLSPSTGDIRPLSESTQFEMVPRKIKFAFTNERTLMIFGIHSEPIELDEKATVALDQFFGKLCLLEDADKVQL